MDAGVMVELGIIQPGDRVYAEPRAGMPWGWGVVAPLPGRTEIYDGVHLYALWENDATPGRPFGVNCARITRWEINPERLEAAE